MIMRSASHLHDGMLSSIMHSKISFFESTPIGRIINRFSKDMNAAEFIIPAALKDFVYTAFEILTILVMISISTPFFATTLVPLGIVYILIEVKIYISRNQIDLCHTYRVSWLSSFIEEILIKKKET